MIAILASRVRVKLAGAMIRAGWAIIEAEERKWRRPAAASGDAVDVDLCRFEDDGGRVS